MSGVQRHHGATRIAAVVLLSLLAIHIGRALSGASGPVVEFVVDDVIYNALILAAAALCLARAATRDADRLAWTAFGAGMLLWSAGEIVWSVDAADGEPPIPSAADVLWIALYPAMYAGLVLLIRSRTRDFRPSIWLDGLTAALGAAAVGAAVLVPVIQAAAAGNSAIETATNLAYPLGDLILLALVVGMLPLLGWRPAPMWALLGAGLVAMAVADTAYLSDMAGGSYVAGGLLESLWPAAALLIGAAAWAPRSGIVTARPGSIAMLAPTVLCALAAIVILLTDHFERFSALAIALSAATLVAVVVRALLAFRENDRVLESLSLQALTDPLTGLGNRRALVQRLEETVGDDPGAGSWLFLLFDLDGFKGYNDSFGHPAGDALLQRLGSRLGAAAGPRGRAYRLGGDEFCVLVPLDGADAEALIDAASGALRAEGEGFDIGASLGAVFLPDEATRVSDALGVADRRLYAAKRSRRASPDWQTPSALGAALPATGPRAPGSAPSPRRRRRADPA
jgi:two-component system cell cycle response regulator